jgi:hypothetical protein
VGKSFTAQAIVDHLHDTFRTRDKVMDAIGIVAPTGVAARVARRVQDACTMLTMNTLNTWSLLALTRAHGCVRVCLSTRTTTASTIHRFFGVKNHPRAPGSPAAVVRGEPTEDERITMAFDADPVETTGLQTATLDHAAIGRIRKLKVLVIDEVRARPHARVARRGHARRRCHRRCRWLTSTCSA